jgi:hypothetical protein
MSEVGDKEYLRPQVVRVIGTSPKRPIMMTQSATDLDTNQVGLKFFICSIDDDAHVEIV